MGIIKKNKRGVSLVELIAAIIIISLASTTITSMVITSYKGQIRAQQYVLANEMAKTYDSMLARDITKKNLQEIADAKITNEDPDEKYVVVTEDTLKDLVKTDIPDDPYGQVYNYLYVSHFELNGMTFDHSNVEIKIYVISKSFGYFKTDVTVTYQGDRQVTYSGTHFKD